MVTRTVKIESPQGNTLRVQAEADIVEKFIKAAQDKRSFRGTDESFQHPLESAVTVAFSKFTEG